MIGYDFYDLLRVFFFSSYIAPKGMSYAQFPNHRKLKMHNQIMNENSNNLST